MADKIFLAVTAVDAAVIPVTVFFHIPSVVEPALKFAVIVFGLSDFIRFAPCDVNSVFGHTGLDFSRVRKLLVFRWKSFIRGETFHAPGLNGAGRASAEESTAAKQECDRFEIHKKRDARQMSASRSNVILYLFSTVN